MIDPVMACFVAGCGVACLLIVLAETAVEFWADIEQDRRDTEEWIRQQLLRSASAAREDGS